MHILITNIKLFILIMSGSIILGVTLLSLMLKLLKVQPKAVVRIIGAWMLVYIAMFFIVPMLTEAIWLWGLRPASEVFIKAISYPFSHSPKIIHQYQAPYLKVELFLYLLWLAYLVSGIGLLRFKNWGRSLGAYTAATAVIFSFGTWLFNGICLDILSPAWPFYRMLASLLANVFPVGLPALLFWLLLIQDPVKVQFSKA